MINVKEDINSNNYKIHILNKIITIIITRMIIMKLITINIKEDINNYNNKNKRIKIMIIINI